MRSRVEQEPRSAHGEPFLGNSGIDENHLTKALLLNKLWAVALQENLLEFSNRTSSTSQPVIPSTRGFQLALVNGRSLNKHIDELRETKGQRCHVFEDSPFRKTMFKNHPYIESSLRKVLKNRIR